MFNCQSSFDETEHNIRLLVYAGTKSCGQPPHVRVGLHHPGIQSSHHHILDGEVIVTRSRRRLDPRSTVR